MTICCEMAVKTMGILGVSVRNMKALTVKMETVTVVGRGTQNLRRFVYLVYTVSSKLFFLADISGGHFRFGQINFPWQAYSFGGVILY